jgi:hypothetical protein
MSRSDDRTREGEPGFSEPEFGSSTGDQRANDPSLPGFTPDDDLVFRSYFQHANQLADRSYEHVRPAYQLGYEAAGDPRYAGSDFDTVEKDLQGKWLNVRVAGDEWQTVRDYARQGFERGRRIGLVSGSATQGTTDGHLRPSFSDPLPGNVDPTSPESPENRAE